MAGIAPWIDLEEGPADERALRTRYRALGTCAGTGPGPCLARRAELHRGRSPWWTRRFWRRRSCARRACCSGARSGDTTRLVAAFESARAIQPGFNNWLLFAATVEAALKALGAPWDRMRVDYALRQHEQWYRGDGAYSDGPAFHWDYYNSFVIHPMLVDVLAAWATRIRPGRRSRPAGRARQRYAAVLERLVAPDGTFPADRPIDCLPLRRVSGAGAGGAATRAACRGLPRAGARGPDRADWRGLERPRPLTPTAG